MPKRLRLAAALALVLLSSAVGRADDVTRFLYEPGRVPVGRVYHYLESNLDGSVPERLAIYVADEDRIEVLSYPGPNRSAVLAVAWMDWLTCDAKRIEFQEIRPGQDPAPILTLVTGPDDRSFEAELPGVLHGAARTDLAGRPWQLYDLDLATLYMILPHLVNPEDSVTIELASRTDGPGRLGFVDRGGMTLKYRGEQVRDGEHCRLYDADGPGLEGRGGTLLVRERDGFPAEVTLGLPADPRHSGLRLLLRKTGHLAPGGWAHMVKTVR